MTARIDEYFRQAAKWRDELTALRSIILGGELAEEWKWGKPCYTLKKRNVVILMRLKAHCALMFCKGALLRDAEGLLVAPGPNTQSGRWIKFTSTQEIAETENVLRTYLAEAVAVEKAGLEVVYKATSEYNVPVEFRTRLVACPALKHAFEALTPGRQRGYLLYFSAPKQSKTRESRIEKCLPRILSGEGLNDRERSFPPER